MELVRVSEELCKTCVWHTRVSIAERMNVTRNCVGCYYAGYVNHSRLYVNGIKVYNPAYCDKYIPKNSESGDIKE